MPEVPYLFDIDAMVKHFVELGVHLTADDFKTAAARLGRNAGPALLVDLHVAGLLGGLGVLGAAVADAWSGCEFPLQAVERELWIGMYGEVGFTIDGVPSVRPARIPQLYRGAPAAHRAGMSWTPDRATAQWFADRNRDIFGLVDAQVWTCRPPIESVLGVIREERPGESEYVVDPSGVTIMAAQPVVEEN